MLVFFFPCKISLKKSIQCHTHHKLKTLTGDNNPFDSSSLLGLGPSFASNKVRNVLKTEQIRDKSDALSA